MEITTERLTVLALQCGLTLSDFKLLTVGMIFDYIDEYIEMKNGIGKEEEQEAGQAEFDRF